MRLFISTMRVATFLALMFGVTILTAQKTGEIQILDPSTLAPISGATYQYAEQSGTTDTEGKLHFQYLEGNTMTLSHIGYGEWKLSDSDLASAISIGTIYRDKQNINLYPVTILALRHKTDEIESQDLTYHDKLAHDGGALLEQAVGINSIKKGGNYGFDPVLRGFKYDQLNIVANGVQSASAACPNRMDPPSSQMAPNMTDRIEILKGPHALRYGSGFGGTINFIPPPLRFSDEPSNYGRVSAGYDSNGDVLRSEGLLGFNGKRYDLGVFASWSQGNDYKAGDESIVQADFLRMSFGANLGLKVADNQELRISATNNIARDADFPALGMDLRDDDTWLFNVSHEIKLSGTSLKSWNSTAFASIVNHKMDNLLKPLEPRMMNATTDANTYNYGARTEGDWQFNNSSLFAGADFRIEGAEGIRTREFLLGPMKGKVVTDNAWQNGHINKFGVFAEYHLQVHSFQFVFSGRLESNSSDISDKDDKFSETHPETASHQINPSLSIGGIKNFDNNISTGLWLGRAQRSGSLTERYINYFSVGQDPYEMLGDPLINPEINNQVDLTFQWRTPKSAINVDLFAAYLQDFITSVIDTSLSPVLPTSPGVRRYVNGKDAFKTGFEISWSQELFAGMQHQMSFAYTYGQDLERNEALPEIAPFEFQYRLMGSYFNNKLHPEITLRQVSKQERVSNEYGETVTPSFTLLSAEVSYQFIPKFGMTIGVQNIFNQTYYEHLSRSVRGPGDVPIYSPGRNFYISANFNFM